VTTNGIQSKYDWIETKNYIDKVLDEEKNANNAAKALKGLTINSTSPKSEIPIKKEEGTGFSKIFTRKRRLVGRGLVGAGNRNLEKDYLYKQIGDKYITLSALAEGYLSLRYPSANVCFKRFKISDDLVSIIKTLAFDKTVDYTAYAQLNNSDKEIFYDLLKFCKILQTLRKPLFDPRQGLDKYKAEFDKLLAELKLGNDNPKVKSELKKMSIYLFQNNQIGEKDFNKIISQLI